MDNDDVTNEVLDVCGYIAIVVVALLLAGFIGAMAIYLKG